MHSRGSEVAVWAQIAARKRVDRDSETRTGTTHKVWSTTETALQSVRSLDLNGEHLDVVSKLKSLEIQLRCGRRMINDVEEERVRKGITASRRIRWAPLPLQTIASLIACLVGPAAMYGLPAGGFTLRLVSSLRTAVVAALWGTKRRSQCREIVLATLRQRTTSRSLAKCSLSEFKTVETHG